MTALYLDNRLLHYEVFGRGQPTIFLHSWLGSWRYWVPSMETISDRYRAYALDFWGFGESERESGNYTLSEYVDLLFGFMQQLGISRANLVGHGLGGMVAVRAASEQPEKFIKVMTICAPIEGSPVAALARSSGKSLGRLFARAGASNVWTRLVRSIPVLDKPTFEELLEDTESLSEQVVQRILETIGDSDLRADLARLQLPLLAIFGERDGLLGTEPIQLLESIRGETHQILMLPRINHFPFLEQPNTFHRLLKDFLTSRGTPVEIKEEWRRRVSQLEYI